MSEVQERLMRCFSAIFPALTPEEILTASPETTGAWDSLASVTLIGVIEEEFGVSIDLLEFGDISSFQGLLERLGGPVTANQ
jgi:acyl carrier protein